MKRAPLPMLWQRVVTALALVGILGAALWYSDEWPFGLLALALVALAVWEWSRLNELLPAAAVASGLLFALLMLASWWAYGSIGASASFWLALALLWLLLLPLLLWRGVAGWRATPRSLRLVLGWFLLAQAWWALLNAKAIGVAMLLSIFMLVWVADTAAYFGGKRFGRRKLAPDISPGKTWEGALSGALAVLLLAALWLLFWPESWGAHLYAALWAQGPLGALLLALLLALSIMGDLLESLVKRSAGRKDSSRILPGHGGVLDRFDAMLPVLPLALATATWASA